MLSLAAMYHPLFGNGLSRIIDFRRYVRLFYDSLGDFQDELEFHVTIWIP